MHWQAHENAPLSVTPLFDLPEKNHSALRSVLPVVRDTAGATAAVV